MITCFIPNSALSAYLIAHKVSTLKQVAKITQAESAEYIIADMSMPLEKGNWNHIRLVNAKDPKGEIQELCNSFAKVPVW